MEVCETKNINLSNWVHIFEPMKVHTFEPNIRLIRLFSLMLNYAKPRLLKKTDSAEMYPQDQLSLADSTRTKLAIDFFIVL